MKAYTAIGLMSGTSLDGFNGGATGAEGGKEPLAGGVPHRAPGKAA